MTKLCDEMATLQDKIDAGNLWELDRQVELSMSIMNLPPPDADVSKLSGGEKRRVAALSTSHSTTGFVAT